MKQNVVNVVGTNNPGLIYSACGSIRKQCERAKK